MGRHARRVTKTGSKSASRRKPRRLQTETLETRRVLSASPIIVDNLSSDFTQSGGWNYGQGIGYNGSILWSNAPFQGDETADWFFDIGSESGQYRIAATWHGGNPAHGSNVPIQISDGSGTVQTFTLNQSLSPDDFVDSGVWWENVGVVEVNGDFHISLSDLANGHAIADAFRIEKVGEAVESAIIDNFDSGFKRSGNWNYADGPGFGGSILWSNLPLEGSEKASWTFVVQPGTYRLAATWHGGSPAHGSNLPLTISTDSRHLDYALLDQTAWPDDFVADGASWEIVGDFTVGNTLHVELTDFGSGYAIADAFRIERIESQPSVTVVDNRSPGFASGGVWNLAGGTGYSDSILWSNAPFQGSEFANWNLALEPGRYQVSTTWHGGNPAHGSNIPVHIFDSSSLIFAATVNQSLSPDDFIDRDRWWENIGVIDVGSGAIRVHLNENANGYAIADAFRFERIDTVYDEKIIDNRSTSFGKSGSWPEQTGSGNDGGFYASSAPFDGTDTAAWQQDQPGAYEVALTWHTGTAGGTNIPVRIYDGPNLIAALSVDQSIAPDDFQDQGSWWKDLGIFTVSQGIRVELDEGTDGPGLADAIRLERISQNSVPVARNDDHFTSVNQDIASTISILANDFSADSTISAAVVEAYPSNGTLIAFSQDGHFTYRPNSNFEGHDSFTYRAVNESGESSVGTVNVSIGGHLSPRLNKNSNILNSVVPDVWLSESALPPAISTPGFGSGLSNVPTGSSGSNPGDVLATGGLLLTEDVAPNTLLVYRSDSLVRPIVSVDTKLVGNDVPTSLTAQLTFDGVTSGAVNYNVNGLAAANQMRFSLQADGAHLPTGVYDYAIEVSMIIGGVAKSQVFTGKQAIVNRNQSEFGEGWALAEIDRVYDSPDGALVVRGSGDAFWMPLDEGAYQRADGDLSYSRLTKLPDGSFELASKSGLISEFSSEGILLRRYDPNGNQVTYSYIDADSDFIADELAQITDTFGRSTTFQYTGSLVSTIQHFSGRATTLQYIGSRLDKYNPQDPDGLAPLAAPEVAFAYSTSGLSSRTSAAGNQTLFFYDADHGRLTSVGYPSTTDVGTHDLWTLDQTVETSTLATAGQSNNAIATPQAIVRDEEVIVDGQIQQGEWKFQTDRFGGITTLESPLGNHWTYERNADGQVVLSRLPEEASGDAQGGFETYFGYTGRNDLAFMQDAVGAKSHYTYSPELSRLTRITDPIGRVQQFIYDSQGNATHAIDGEGFVTTSTYNARGQLASVTAPDPDGSGPQPASTAGFEYDSFGRLTRTINPDNSDQNFTYNAADQLESILDELDYETSMIYDLLGRVTSSTNREAEVTTYTYDSASRLTSTVDPLLNTTTYEYNARDQIDNVTLPDPDGSGPLPSPEDFFVYDARGNLTKHGDPRGNFTGSIFYEYDAENRLIAMGENEDSDRIEQYQYDPMGRMTGVIRVPYSDSPTPPPPFDETYVEYDNLGRVVLRVTHTYTPDGSIPNSGDWLFSERFEYDEAGQLIKRIDGNDQVYENVYDNRGLLLQEVMPDPDGNGPQFPLTIRYAFDNMGRMTSQDRGFDRVTYYAYDSRSRLTQVNEPDPDGSGPGIAPVTTFAYDVRSDITSVTAPLSRVTSFEYDAEQRLIQETAPDPDGAGPLFPPISQWTYNANGWMTNSLDAVGAETSFEYDNLGRITKMIEPDPDNFGPGNDGPLPSPQTMFSYATFGLEKVTDPLLKETTYQRDTRGRVFQMTDPTAGVTQYEYDFYDNLREMTSPDPDGLGPEVSPVTKYVYDGFDRLTSITEPRDNTTEPDATTDFYHDRASNLVKVSDRKEDGANDETTYAYDNLNRVVAETTAYGTRHYVYDVAGNMTRSIDRNDHVIQYAYDKLDRPIEEMWQTYPADATITISETVKGGPATNEQQRIQVFGGSTLGGIWYLAFQGEVTEPIQPYAQAYEVEAALNALPSIDNVTVSGSYLAYDVTFGGAQAGQDLPSIQGDAANLTVGNFEHTISTEYNAASEIVGISEPSGFQQTRDMTFARDQLGRTTTLTTVDDAWHLGPVVLNQAYDAVGNRLQVTANVGGAPDFQNDYQHDKLRRVTEITQSGMPGVTHVTPKRVTQSYNALGQMDRVERYESLGTSAPVASTDYSYDYANRLETIAHQQNTTPLNDYDFDYDFLSRITSVDSPLDDLTTYTYDQRSQLTSAINDSLERDLGHANYEYDINGNRDSSGYVNESHNRTTASPEGTYTYDYEGNVTQFHDGQTTFIFTWDHRNRLVAAHEYGSGVNRQVQYEYDAFNRLHSRTSTPGELGAETNTRYFVYDEGINPLLSIEDLHNRRELYLWSDAVDVLLAAERTGLSENETYWALSDHLSTIRDIAVYDETTGITQIANHRQYDAFGNLLEESDPSVDLMFGYTGKLFDEVTGLQNNLNRWYDPKLGKWISQDPIGFAAGDANLYRYVGNGPVDSRDPSGLVDDDFTTVEDWWGREYEVRNNSFAIGAGWIGANFIWPWAGGNYPKGHSRPNRVLELGLERQARLNYEKQFVAGHTGSSRANPPLSDNVKLSIETLAKLNYTNYEIATGLASAAQCASLPLIGPVTNLGDSQPLFRRISVVGQGEVKVSANLVDQLALPDSIQRALLRESLEKVAGPGGAGTVGHHIIPLALRHRFPRLFRKAAEGGFDLNGFGNGIRLFDRDRMHAAGMLTDDNVGMVMHSGNHPNYSQVVGQLLNMIPKNLSPADTAKEFSNLASRLRCDIIDNKFPPIF